MVLYEIWSVGREPLPGISIKEVFIVLCIVIFYTREYVHICIQVPDLVTNGFCQAPPPGCPRAIYELMVKLWYAYCCVGPNDPSDIGAYPSTQEPQEAPASSLLSNCAVPTAA